MRFDPPAYASTHYDNDAGTSDSAIKLLSWPDGNVKAIVYNLSDGVRELRWSPSGDKLAFVSAMGDTSSNVFVYDTATEESTRIAVTDFVDDRRLQWSTDERYVIFETYYWSPMGGNISTELCSARADAGGVIQLADSPRTQAGWDVEYLGWLSPAEVILSIMRGFSEDEVYIANIETGQRKDIDREPLLDVAYSPEHNLFLMTKDVDPAPNRLLIFYQNGERREVTGYTIKYVEWLSAYNVFLGQTPSGHVYLISPEGAVTEIPSPGWKVESDHHVIVSPDSQWWAWHKGWNTGQDRPGKYSEIWVGPAMAQPSALLHYSEVVPDYRVYSDDVRWSPDSRYLLWASGQGIFAASPPNFEAALVAKIGATFSDAVWVQ